MTGEIKITFHTERNIVQVQAPMQTTEEKKVSVNVLLSAIQCVMNYEASPIIKPAAMLPMTKGNGNGLEVVN